LNGVRIYAKRDDLRSLGGGGNKLRKLEFLLGDAAAARADTIIATGGRQSNFARSTDTRRHATRRHSGDKTHSGCAAKTIAKKITAEIQYVAMERAKGIEPSYEAWEASVLPLNYARISET
jgi:1-aminocyclopropane-1-carboxylate deaminase/D-cysteine desulfhydrase-like pyridoxal-dependent ACC family enzyme